LCERCAAAFSLVGCVGAGGHRPGVARLCHCLYSSFAARRPLPAPCALAPPPPVPFWRCAAKPDPLCSALGDCPHGRPCLGSLLLIVPAALCAAVAAGPMTRHCCVCGCPPAQRRGRLCLSPSSRCVCWSFVSMAPATQYSLDLPAGARSLSPLRRRVHLTAWLSCRSTPARWRAGIA
jgi:hypothetical protein